MQEYIIFHTQLNTILMFIFFSFHYPGWHRGMLSVVLVLMSYLYHQLDTTIASQHPQENPVKKWEFKILVQSDSFGTDISIYNPDRQSCKRLETLLRAPEQNNKSFGLLGSYF